MIKVAGVWEQGWTTPIMEYDLWNYPLTEFGVDEFIMTPISGISRKITEYPSMEEILEVNKDLQIVAITEKGEVDLEYFQHPKDVLYVFGKVSFDPTGDISVRINTPKMTGSLWPHQAACIVLRDRWLKWR